MLHIAKQTIQIERDTLSLVEKQIDRSFVKAVRAISSSHGRLIVTGIGKSAIIAQKIVATMNSTGTPSLFMHAVDAIHGDLGMLMPDDILLCLSKSGETDEIKVLLPLIRNFGNPIIGMSSNPSSFLAKQSDYFLYTPIEKEADPNNLAPTASTTAQMALGDALATCLLALKGFTPHDFAQYHPGGSLGKQLYLKVRDLVRFNEKPLVQEDSSLRDTILEISAKRLGATAVAQNQTITGIVTDGDVRRLLERESDVSHLRAKDMMSRTPKSIQADEFAVKAFQYMKEHNIQQLIVFDADTYLGLIHLHDLLKEGIV